MPYSNFSFYQTDFCGSLISSEEEYNSAAVKAGCYLDWLSNGSIKQLDEVPSEVMMAECAVSELYFENEQRRGISAETNDGYRVEFKEPCEVEMYRTAVRYLPSALVYRGIGV